MAILLPPPPPIPWRSLSAIHRTRSFHLLSREALPQRDLHYRVGATAATAPVAAACHGAAGPLRPAAGHRKTALRSAWGAHGLFWRPRDEAAAAGGGLQGVRGGGQGEGVPPPGPQVVQAQMLPHLEYLTTVRRRAPTVPLFLDRKAALLPQQLWHALGGALPIYALIKNSRD